MHVAAWVGNDTHLDDLATRGVAVWTRFRHDDWADNSLQERLVTPDGIHGLMIANKRPCVLAVPPDGLQNPTDWVLWTDVAEALGSRLIIAATEDALNLIGGIARLH